MTTTKQLILMWCVMIPILAMGIVLLFIKQPLWNVDLVYLSQTNQDGHPVAFFTISNAGLSTVTHNGPGTIEIFGQNTTERVEYEADPWKLQPGQSETAQVLLPDTMKKPWRLTIYYEVIGRSTPRMALSEWIKEPSNNLSEPK